MCDAQREMTLEEWVYQLPEIHKARREYEQLKAITRTPASAEVGKLRGAPPSKEPKVRELEEWIQMILDGKEVSEFALSYPIVRQVWDLKQEASHD